MGRKAAVPLMVLAVLLVGLTACVNSSGPGRGPATTLPGLVVSQPVPALRNGAGAANARPSSAANSTGGASLVYVSLVPGSVPEGGQATITDQATGQSVTGALVDGGFDPVAIAASVGDTLVVEITRAGLPLLRVVEEVARHRPPVVVRTNPPANKIDVPLNADMVVVFSTPIDSTTLTTQSVQLLRGGTAVAGTVGFVDTAHLKAEFRPDSVLASETVYELVVTQAILDLNGLALTAPVDVPFTTGTPVGTQNGSVSGVVSSSMGGGLPGFSVEVTQTTDQPPVELLAVMTGPDGSYTVSNVPPGGGVVFVAVPSAWYCTAPAPVAFRGLTAGETVTVNVTVPCTPSPWDY